MHNAGDGDVPDANDDDDADIVTFCAGIVNGEVYVVPSSVPFIVVLLSSDSL